jgi:hypothetical protein
MIMAETAPAKLRKSWDRVRCLIANSLLRARTTRPGQGFHSVRNMPEGRRVICRANRLNSFVLVFAAFGSQNGSEKLHRKTDFASRFQFHRVIQPLIFLSREGLVATEGKLQTLPVLQEGVTGIADTGPRAALY